MQYLNIYDKIYLELEAVYYVWGWNKSIFTDSLACKIIMLLQVRVSFYLVCIAKQLNFQSLYLCHRMYIKNVHECTKCTRIYIKIHVEKLLFHCFCISSEIKVWFKKLRNLKKEKVAYVTKKIWVEENIL